MRQSVLLRHIFPGLTIAVLLFVAAFFLLHYYCASAESVLVCRRIDDKLKGKIVFRNSEMTGFAVDIKARPTLIYVLGGNQADLAARYKVAAELYHRKVSGTIHFLSREGITEFSPELKRNLKNDEWSIREMGYHRVKAEDTPPVSVPPGVFGTLSEAEAVARIIRGKGYGSVVLVSSVHHTRRVYSTFRSVLSSDPTEIHVFGAEDGDGLDRMLEEYVKLLSYEYIALPARRALLSLKAAGVKYKTEIGNTKTVSASGGWT
jgi:hypothetical protein